MTGSSDDFDLITVIDAVFSDRMPDDAGGRATWIGSASNRTPYRFQPLECLILSMRRLGEKDMHPTCSSDHRHVRLVGSTTPSWTS